MDDSEEARVMVAAGGSPDGEKWVVPDSLRGPVRQVPTNLAIRMLSCELLDHEVKALVGQFIAEASLCYLRPVEAPMNFDRQARFGDALRGSTRIVYEGWEEFRTAIEGEGCPEEVRESIRQGKSMLISRLQAAVDRLRALPDSII
ncbi:hypothetical protein ACGFYY_24525 [Streptomyces sp. NPDC048331]|uniref:hypothetical protein n=1 Tax=Streptomyces sp. NPDC048331 TaxID=3365534 RepID=UPI00372382BC